MKIFEKIKKWLGFEKVREYYLTLPEIKLKSRVEVGEDMPGEDLKKIEYIEKIIKEIPPLLYETYQPPIFLDPLYSGSDLGEEDKYIGNILVGIPESLNFSEILAQIVRILKEKGIKVGKIKEIKKGL